ncbi:hypothetical protein PROFUN_16318 [Planoprotostelium fungivorum]|uniref:Protein kinase domain-containing protein n=1 Tax=Planoprotostelium fungivorum TaxID=1890364 RepID=A0A2P6MRA4_9EUKA|nr:hypothetical protein PROFUN_16318 [Planoprotostelium fungivorum]
MSIPTRPPIPPPRNKIGKIVAERWRLETRIGSGAKGLVYKATDLRDHSLIALKEISTKKFSPRQKTEAIGEAEILHKLDQPNIIKVYEWLEWEGSLYISFELMSEGSLGKTLRQHGALPEEVAGRYIYQILSALEYLHSQQLIHRDIKGDNILISADGRAVLADFGLAVKVDNSDGCTDDLEDAEPVGTPYWLAPEVILMMAQTTASDIWSIGCTIIELLTGSPPYAVLPPMAAIFRMVQDERPPLPEGLSPHMESFLLKCLTKEVSSRPSATQLLEHSYLEPHRTAACMAPEEMYDRVRLYNRRPTVHSMLDFRRSTVVFEGKGEGLKSLKRVESPIEIPEVTSDAASDVNERSPRIERINLMNSGDKNNEIARFSGGSSPRRSSVVTEGSGLMDKYNTILQRIYNKQMQQNLLLRLSKLYHNHLREERENCEKQLKLLEEGISKDLAMKESITKALKKHKMNIYDVGRIIHDVQGDTELISVKSGELIFILSMDGPLWQGENITGEVAGWIQPTNIELLNKSARRHTSSNSTSPTVKLRSGTGDEQDLKHDSERLRDKISSFLGLSSPDRKSFLGLSPEKKSSSFKRRNGNKSVVKDQVAPEKLKLYALIAGDGVSDATNLMRDYIRDGAFTVSVKHKLSERHVFLFSDCLIISKQKEKSSELRTVLRIPLGEECRLIMDIDTPDVFWVGHKDIDYTFMPMLGTASPFTPSQACRQWFTAIKEVSNDLLRKRFNGK